MTDEMNALLDVMIYLRKQDDARIEDGLAPLHTARLWQLRREMAALQEGQSEKPLISDEEYEEIAAKRQRSTEAWFDAYRIRLSGKIGGFQ